MPPTVTIAAGISTLLGPVAARVVVVVWLLEVLLFLPFSSSMTLPRLVFWLVLEPGVVVEALLVLPELVAGLFILSGVSLVTDILVLGLRQNSSHRMPHVIPAAMRI